jgi:Zn-dependent peptidase ImmA (M78 family)
MAEVPVNGKVLAWARTLRGLDVENAATLLDISPDELRAFESEAKRPLVSLLRQMSAKYHINFTSLLMPEPLPLEEHPTDYRVRRGKRSLSIDTLVAREEVLDALEAFEDIGAEAQRIVPKLNIGRAALEEEPEAVAVRERKRFGVSVLEQRQWKSLGDARREWRKRIEKHGVFTYMIPMPPDELSGFAILHNGLAAICVNDKEATEGAKIFTLFHEYCHLLLRETGISDENNSNRVERFCNEFAASFLIPRNSLIEAIGNVQLPHVFSNADVKRFATRFRVSNSAVALRLEKTGCAPKGFYDRCTGRWDPPAEPRPVASEPQPSYLKMRLKRIGRLHATTILRAVERGVMNSFDASQLIGLRASTFSKVKAELG